MAWLLVETIIPSQILHIPRLIAMDGTRKSVLQTSLGTNEGFPFNGKEDSPVCDFAGFENTRMKLLRRVFC